MFSPSNDEKKVRRFIDTAFTDDKTAKKYLKRNKWIVERALNDYYNTGGDEGKDDYSRSIMYARLRFFLQFADPKGNCPSCSVMDEEGVERLCQALGIEPVDPRILVFCACCDATTMGKFSKAEFINGLSTLNVVSLEELKSQLPEWQKTLTTPELARPVYRFLFKYALEGTSKSLSIDMAREYWELILPDLDFELYNAWIEYVDEVLSRRENFQISRDVWNVVFDFLKMTHESDIKTFDTVSSAWPTVIDDFVEWFKDKMPNQ
eukprot:Gregarina_sp_Poly_1__2372@NODE_1635_length_3667_cov_217_740556_g1079_i0_p1_GENE_NODE_1635_length_3667_cov_217_740556_g1079_i0NODE_1635_length_3667_cov_217_740556_g1079_i0_p1_ORF_typecomplete_len264_score35_92Cullin_binding/PF03556_15/8_4e28UBA_4/PF14555_6/2_7e06_NODE_1635_length_3667_cov_217_740556_g1079_i021282919